MSNTTAGAGTLASAGRAPGNTVATIGLILTLVAGLMCGLLFAAASRLPETQSASASPEDPPGTAAEKIDVETADGQPAGSNPAVSGGQPVTRADAVDSELEARRLQVLLLASAAAVLNLVGLVLSIAGLFVPNRPRAIAICGTVLSLLLFAGVFGVMAVGALLNPAAMIVLRPGQ